MTNRLGPRGPRLPIPHVLEDIGRGSKSQGIIPSFPRSLKEKNPGKFKGIHEENLINEFGTLGALAPKGWSGG